MPSASQASSRFARGALLLMAGSGFAGLGYQLVWTQQSAVWLGTEAAAVLAIVAAFFAGLSLGALLLGPRIERSARPLRWYASCEALIGVWAVALTRSIAPFGEHMLDLIGVAPGALWQWSVSFVATFALLLPATVAMGATLPAMERLALEWQAEGRSVAWLYASNTAGALVSVLAIAFWLVPTFGLTRVALFCAGINLACALAAFIVFRSRATVPMRRLTAPASHARGVLVRLAITGLLGIGYEVLALRVLGQVTEGTVFTFALLLAVYLLGTAAGAMAYGRWLARRGSSQDATHVLLVAQACACLIGAAGLWNAETIEAHALLALRPGLPAAFATESLLALTAFAAPTLVMGALFSHLSAQAIAAGVGFGRALGCNTLGAALAPLLFGVLVTPTFGAKTGLLVVSFGYLALLPARAWRARLAYAPLAVAGTAVAVALWAPPLRILNVPPGGRVLKYAEGALGTVSVVQDDAGVARLRIDNHQQEGSNASLRVDARQGVLPLLLHTAPRRALFLGLGTGVTASAAAAYTGVRVDVAELVPQVIDAAALFTPVVAPPGSLANLHAFSADARRFVRASTAQYDVIVADNFHPARSGSASLYTIEHFQAVRARLASDGLFCQWLPLHQLDLRTLRSIVRSFLHVYPHGSALLASYSLETPVLGLLGRADDGRFDAAALRARLRRDPAPQARYAELGIEDELALLGSFVADADGLRHFAGNAPANTDDRPLVAYRAPHILYAVDSAPGDRLVAFLRQVSVAPAEILSAPDAEPALQDYWRARDRFVAAGRSIVPSTDPRQMLVQVGTPLLAILHISPEFRPAYDPLLRIATALSPLDEPQARSVLAELVSVQPARDEARLALMQLQANSSR